MKHALLILAHKDANHLAEMIRFFQEEYYVYIHIDKKSTISSAEQAALRKMKNVRFVQSRYSINWGGYRVLKGVVYLMKMAAAEGLADYYHLISGQDFPTKSLQEFQRYFEQRKGTEFLDYFVRPDREWENEGKNRLTFYSLYDFLDIKKPRHVEVLRQLDKWQKVLHIRRKLPLRYYPLLYGGSCWWSLTRDCLQYVVQETEQRPSFYRWLRFAFAPDEVYVQTVLLNSPFRSRIENDNLRYICWEKRNGNYPANLDETDFEKIIKSNKLFARKIEYPISTELVDKLKNRKVKNVRKDELPISVVMAVYNTSPYLRECVDSILNQSFQDFEFIIVDDGSTDDGLSILKSYTDPRIRIIENKHDYIDSLNKGLNAARGTYIAHMDSDDISSPERLSTQYNFMESHPKIVLCGSWHTIFGVGHPTTYRAFPCKYNEIVLNIIHGENPMSHPTVFLRREFLIAHQLQYSQDSIYAEDFRLWVEIIKAGGGVENLPVCIHSYRQSETQLIRTRSVEMSAMASQVYYDFLEYVMGILGEENEKLSLVMEQLILLVNEGTVPYAALREFVYETYSDYLHQKDRQMEVDSE